MKPAFFSGWTKAWISAVLCRETQCFQGFAPSFVNTNKHQKTLENPHLKRLEIDLFTRYMDLYPNDYIKQLTSFMFDVIELEDESAETTINLVLYSLANPKIEYEDNVFKQS